jgi:hypothetical protein
MLPAISIPDHLPDDLSAFAASVEGTSLYLLRAIDQTVENLQISENLARATSDAAAFLTRKISARKAAPEIFIDPEDVAINGLESGYKSLEEFLPSLLLKKTSIDKDRNLKDDHSQLLHVAYERCIKALAELIESAKELRAAVIRHDLAAESKTREGFESVDDLIDSLHSA